MLETLAPESINKITFCLSTIMVASLDLPTRQAIRSGLKNGTVGVTSHGPVCQATLILVSSGLGFGRECWGTIVGCGSCYQWGELHSLNSPSWFKANGGVGHSLAMWPHP